MSQSALVKIGLPSQQAEGARFARRVRQILEQRDAAFARVEADFRARMKDLTDEELAKTTDDVVEETATASAPAPA